MNKKNQLLISFILLLCFTSAIVYSIIRKEENGRKSYKEVNTIFQQDKYIKNADVYNEFLKNYNCQGEEYYYSFIELDGYDYPILLLSDGVYKYKNEREVAMCTDIYYSVNNEVTLFGNICSNGTAYPISANTTGIYTAGGHEVAKYNLETKSLKLKLINKYIIFFHEMGNEIKAISIGIVAGKNIIVGEEEFNEAYKEYENAKIIYFKHLCNN